MSEKIEALEAEVERLKQVVKDLTEALKVLAEKEERAQEFIARVEAMLS